jgi:hypothetical protein
MIYFFTILILAVIALSVYLSQIDGPPDLGKFFKVRPKPTMFDVRELIIKGQKETAIRTYCQIFSVKRKIAQAAIEELQRSIQQKNFEV